MSTLAEKIDVMQAFKRGEKIQSTECDNGWTDEIDPIWDWAANDYRIAPPEPKRIKLLAFIDPPGDLRWIREDMWVPIVGFTRVPAEDKEILL